MLKELATLALARIAATAAVRGILDRAQVSNQTLQRVRHGGQQSDVLPFDASRLAAAKRRIAEALKSEARPLARAEARLALADARLAKAQLNSDRANDLAAGAHKLRARAFASKPLCFFLGLLLLMAEYFLARDWLLPATAIAADDSRPAERAIAALGVTPLVLVLGMAIAARPLHSLERAGAALILLAGIAGLTPMRLEALGVQATPAMAASVVGLLILLWSAPALLVLLATPRDPAAAMVLREAERAERQLRAAERVRERALARRNSLLIRLRAIRLIELTRADQTIREYRGYATCDVQPTPSAAGADICGDADADLEQLLPAVRDSHWPVPQFEAQARAIEQPPIQKTELTKRAVGLAVIGSLALVLLISAAVLAPAASAGTLVDSAGEIFIGKPTQRLHIVYFVDTSAQAQRDDWVLYRASLLTVLRLMNRCDRMTLGTIDATPASAWKPTRDETAPCSKFPIRDYKEMDAWRSAIVNEFEGLKHSIGGQATYVIDRLLVAAELFRGSADYRRLLVLNTDGIEENGGTNFSKIALDAPTRRNLIARLNLRKTAPLEGVDGFVVGLRGSADVRSFWLDALTATGALTGPERVGRVSAVQVSR
jgi:hypothetical protein